MMTLEEVWENLRQDPEIKATMEEVERSYKLFKKIENLIVADLEAKLAESESKVAVGRFWHSAYEGKQLDYDKLNDDYNKQEKLLSEVLANKSKLQFEFDQLKQQLAEKEKEIEELNKFMSDKADEIEDLKERISNKITSAYGAELMARDIQWHLEKEIQELKQSQNQTAIAELEKVKEYFKRDFEIFTYIDATVLYKQLDQQIKSLKGENDGKGSKI